MSIREKLLNRRKPFVVLSPEERQAEIERVRNEDNKAMNKALFWGVFWFAVVYIPLSVLAALLK